MPRKQFKLASDAASRVVDCEKYDFNAGAPKCDALNHPWCLAPGGSPLSCSFRVPRTEAEPNHEAD